VTMERAEILGNEKLVTGNRELGTGEWGVERGEGRYWNKTMGL